MISLRDWVGVGRVPRRARDAQRVQPLLPAAPRPTPSSPPARRGRPPPGLPRRPGSRAQLAAGRMAPELLGSVNARPAALERAGYDFEDEDVVAVLASALV